MAKKWRHSRCNVVDDKIALDKRCYTVTAVSKSLDALSLFSDDPAAFDLVITDPTMPGVTGDQLALKILAQRPDIPIILCTGFSHVINGDHAKSIGIREVIMKPVASKELSAVVCRALDQSPSRGGSGEDTNR